MCIQRSVLNHYIFRHTDTERSKIPYGFNAACHHRIRNFLRSGIGKVNAGICTQILADLFDVTNIINTGIAGSLDAQIDIGDIVVSTDVLQHDMDVRVFGF